jgi:formiminotetrahydrofolate cyclodeaminase
MTLTSQPLSTVLEAFRSSAPTPGGGSAAALAGAVGASLLAMVAALPKPRATTAPDVERLAAGGKRCTDLAQELEALIDRDSEAYDGVVSAYRLPKTTDEEKAARSDRIQSALKAAIDAPLEVMRACAAGIAQGPTLTELGNPNASSDVQVGLELLHAGLRGARQNVDINLTGLKDTEYVARVSREIDRLSSQALKAFAIGRAQLLDE